MAEPRLVAGRYAILGELGRGGMGVVWLAEDRVIGRRVALKELPFPPGHDPAVFQERVLREARTAGGLNDPAIVTVFDVSFERGFAYLVMELVQAPTLADLIAGGPLAEARVVTIARQVLGALKSAHDAGIVHRDVKPSNIMVLPGDRVKLADFGIARGVDDPSLTATGGIMGSPGYMAPELFAGSQPAPASDLWSLGATLFHAVEGKAPFTRTTTAATMHAILTERPQPSRCGEPLASLLNGLLSQDPAERLAGPRAAALLGAGADTDPEATVTFPPVAAPEHATEVVSGATELVAGPTMAVAAPQRSTRENVMDASAPAWADEDPWDDKRPTRKLPALLAGAAAVVVAALVTVFVLVPGDDATPTAMPVVDKQGQTSSPPATTPESPASSAPSSTAPPSDSASASPSAAPSASASIKPTTVPAGSPTQVAPTTTVPTTTPPPTWTRTTVTRYNHTAGWHITTTSAYPPPAGFKAERPLGALSAKAAPGTKKLYSCKQNTSDDHFTSADQSGGCEGHKVVGLLGYIFTAPPEGAKSASLYRCTFSGGHFDSIHSGCEGYNQEYRLGYLLI